MPLASTKFAPGFDKQSTAYGAEGKWTDGENVRFRYGQPEKIGGWIKLFGDKLIGSVRDQFAWSALDGTRHLAFGTDKKLYIYKEGAIADVTPIRATQANLTNPFVTTNGSAIVTVTDAAHGAKAGDFVTFSNSDAVGGLDMDAEFEITSVTSTSVYTVTHSSNATSGATGGGSSTVDVSYQISPGPETNIYGYGWGIPSWNGTPTPLITDQLAEALDATETAIDVDTGATFAANDYILVGQEIMKVSSVSSNTLTVIRGLSTITDTTSVSAVGSHDNTTHADNASVTLIFDASTSITTTGWNVAATTSATTLDARYWVFESFGEDLLALLSDGALYKWDTSVGTGTRAAIVDANAPTASRHLILSTPDRHLILFGTETTIGTTSTQDDLFLRFSSQEDFTTWSPTSTNTAGSFRIQDGSKIMTAVRSRGDILVWTDTSLHSLKFIGAPFIFGLTQVGANCGAVSPHCAVDVNGTTFWMSQQAFYMFDGGIKKLPCTVQDYVFDNFSITQQNTVYAGINTDFNEVTWFYASKGSSVINRSVTFNYLENVWYTNSLARTTWLDRGVYDAPYATEYDSTANGTTPTVKGLTDGSSNVYVHESGTDDVISAMDCFLQSSDFDINDGQQLLSISRFIPDFKDQTGNTEVLLSFKDYNSVTNETTLNGAITSSSSTDDITLTSAANFPSSGTILIGTELITYTSKSGNVLGGTITRGTNSTTASTHLDDRKVTNYSNVRINLSTVTPTTTKIDTRGRGRQGNLLISSNAVGDNWRFGTLRLDTKPDGGR
jgi:hypothetical protein|tara:strand:+ start:3434 stop:5785 length:2352 start_codon:yes stop_codon:yes gene_type:complete